jgi:hypothetical protein
LSPKLCAKNVAAAALSRAGTIVWLSVIMRRSLIIDSG